MEQLLLVSTFSANGEKVETFLQQMHITNVVMYLFLFFGIWAVIAFIGTSIYSFYKYRKKEKSLKIWPPFISYFKESLPKSNTSSVVFMAFIIISFWITIAYLLELIIKAIS